eukprot:529864-Amphidinium_carterae.2
MNGKFSPDASTADYVAATVKASSSAGLDAEVAEPMADYVGLPSPRVAQECVQEAHPLSNESDESTSSVETAVGGALSSSWREQLNNSAHDDYALRATPETMKIHPWQDDATACALLHVEMMPLDAELGSENDLCPKCFA